MSPVFVYVAGVCFEGLSLGYGCLQMVIQRRDVLKLGRYSCLALARMFLLLTSIHDFLDLTRALSKPSLDMPTFFMIS